MKCPHCLVEINQSFQEIYLGNDPDSHFSIFYMTCPNLSCRKMIIQLGRGASVSRPNPTVPARLYNIKSMAFVNPITSQRPPAPPEVDKMFADEYNEACLIISFSPKASAALSRRCLQNILREKAGIKKRNLSDEIQEIIDEGKLPSYLSESIDAIRNIGNFAAHPIKSTATGEIVEVEQNEAEWLLDVLESLFDFYFVQPVILQSKRNALNAKLNGAGKLPMK